MYQSLQAVDFAFETFLNFITWLRYTYLTARTFSKMGVGFEVHTAKRD